MAAGDTLRRITTSDQLILNSSGAVVGVKNPNANGADLRFDPAAAVITQGTIAGVAASAQMRDFNVHAARVAEPPMQLDLPSPYYPSLTTSKEHAYGTPIYFANGFNGWKFWMVAAPYPTQAPPAGGGSVNKYENPCIYVSNDGETWQTPAGLTNPIATSVGIAENSGLSYYADPYITTDATQSKLYVIWCWFQRLSGSIVSSLVVSESSDGIAWTAPVSIFDSTTSTITANSPNLWWNGSGWTCLVNDTRDATGTFLFKVMRTSSATPYTGWSAFSVATATHPLGRNFWHQHCVPMKDGTIVGLVADGSSSGGYAYSMKSVDDGSSWSIQPFSAVVGNATWYRPSLCICNDGVTQKVLMYATRIGPLQSLGFWVQKAELRDDYVADVMVRALTRSAVNTALASPTNVLKAGLLAWDSFNRADSATVMGTPDGGPSNWVNQTGNWGISTNRGYAATTGNNIATMDVKSSDYDFEAQIVVLGTNFYLAWNFVDGTNFMRWNVINGQVQRVVAGSATTLGTTATAAAVGDVVRVVKRGLYSTLYVNERIADSLKETINAKATLVGVQGSGATQAIIENFIVRLP